MRIEFIVSTFSVIVLERQTQLLACETGLAAMIVGMGMPTYDEPLACETGLGR